ncbi:Lsr2 family protein [Actinophytocola sp.]|uniref:histone-like nucleoid-structuring protein Lsr2 n=1 Tax=Actinophytocola sp. TaxID=1872138 RepID=UPI002ED65FA6
MAQRTLVKRVDDIDGSEPARAVQFALDGVEYEIDLSGANEERLRSVFEEFVAGARRTGGRVKRPTGAARPSKVSDPEAPAIREWAASQGISMGKAGRIPNGVRDQFHAANIAPKAAPRRRKR